MKSNNFKSEESKFQEPIEFIQIQTIEFKFCYLKTRFNIKFNLELVIFNKQKNKQVESLKVVK